MGSEEINLNLNDGLNKIQDLKDQIMKNFMYFMTNRKKIYKEEVINEDGSRYVSFKIRRKEESD